MSTDLKSRRSPDVARGAKADAVLWILAGVSIALLAYEGVTLVTAVLSPLVNNPNALQTDFHYYYEAAVRFRADPSQLYRLSDDVIAGFAYPPPAILPFVALSHLPLGNALVQMTIASYAAIVIAIALWIRYLNHREVAVDWRTAVAAGLIAVALGPTYSNAIFGQVNAFVVLCTVAFVTMGPRWPAAGGAFLAMGVWLKIYPVLMIVIGLWNRSAWRRIVYAGVGALVVAVIALPIVPLSTYQSYVTEVLPLRFDKTAVHISNQALVAFIERFAIPPERFLNWTGEQAITVGPAIRAFNWALGVAVITLLWRRAGRGPRVEAVDSAAGLMALAAVIAPLGWGHTFVLVLPLVILHVVSLRDASPLQVVIAGCCVAAMMIPAGRRFWFIEQMPGWAQNLAYSRYLLATLVLIALPPAIASFTDTRR
jgi:alpha-1,2-mannosyltransferase